MSIQMTDPCSQCGENRWLNQGTREIPIMREIPKDLLEKHHRGEIKIDFEEYRLGHVKTAGFTCKSCGYTVMKDEHGNVTPWNYTDIEK